MFEEEEEVEVERDWVCLDDGTGKKVFYIDRLSGKLSLNPPKVFNHEFLPFERRKYYHRGSCIRCREESSPIFLTSQDSQIGFSTNLCGKCLISIIPSLHEMIEENPLLKSSLPQVPTKMILSDTEIIELYQISTIQSFYLSSFKQLIWETLINDNDSRFIIPFNTIWNIEESNLEEGYPSQLSNNKSNFSMKMTSQKFYNDLLQMFSTSSSLYKWLNERKNISSTTNNMITTNSNIINLFGTSNLQTREQRHRLNGLLQYYQLSYQMKFYRKQIRYQYCKWNAKQYDIDYGEYLSWGFHEKIYNEYFGEIDKIKQIPNGLGVKFYYDGSIYAGGWLNGERHSETKSIWIRPDGCVYEGTWLHDYKFGYGQQTYPDGSVYIGEFAKGYEHGHGVKRFAEGGQYDGRFRYGRRDGPGTLTHPNGKIERGVFRVNDTFNEKPLIEVVEELPDEELIKMNFPKTLLSIALEAVANVMRNHRNLIPSELAFKRIPKHLKKRVVETLFRTMVPPGAPELCALAPTFGFQPLPQVNISHFRLRNRDSDLLLYILGGNTSLKEISLVNVYLDSTSLEVLCRKLHSQEWPNLRLFDLSFNKIDLVILENILSAIQAITSLRVIKLAGCRIDARGALSIAKFISNNKSVEEIDLSFNQIGAVGVDPIADALSSNSTLTRLNLRHNNLGRAGGESLVRALRGSHRLSFLCVADNKMTVEITAAISSRLRGSLTDVIKSFAATELKVPSRHAAVQQNPRKAIIDQLEPSELTEDSQFSLSSSNQPSTKQSQLDDNDEVNVTLK